jgi:hypothetical protein
VRMRRDQAPVPADHNKTAVMAGTSPAMTASPVETYCSEAQKRWIIPQASSSTGVAVA